MTLPMQWSAVILAGDRGPQDPVASVANVYCKAQAQFGGKAMIEYVLAALKEANAVNHVLVVGPTRTSHIAQWLDALANQYECLIIAPEDGPSASAVRAIEQISQFPCLLLTCDLPLLTGEMIDQYCQHVQSVNADIVAAYVPKAKIHRLLPNMKKTVYNSAGEEVCFANLFAVLNANGVRGIRFWRSIETQRKNPLAIIKMLGLKNLIRYKAGKLDLQKESEQLSALLGCEAELMALTEPGIAIDVDSAEDYQLLGKYLSRSKQG